MTIVKQTNDYSEYVDWLERAVTENHIKYYNYSDFTNMKEINNGSVGNIYQANWKGTDTLLVVKSSYKLSIEEIVNEVLLFYKFKMQDIINWLKLIQIFCS